jgi:hypothetical protein
MGELVGYFNLRFGNIGFVMANLRATAIGIGTTVSSALNMRRLGGRCLRPSRRLGGSY